MRLLVSPMNIEEARAALAGGADILDVKNPREGSLGANFPWAIRAVADLARGRVPVSATIGDLEFKPGTASLAALGAAASGAEYIKAGLLGVKTSLQAEEMLEGIVRAVKDFDPQKKVVASGYSDYARVGSISPLLLPAAAAKAGADLVMVDTAVKDGKPTFDFMSEKRIARILSISATTMVWKWLWLAASTSGTWSFSVACSRISSACGASSAGETAGAPSGRSWW